MAKYIGQVAGIFSRSEDIMNTVIKNSHRKAKSIIKIGIQLERGKTIALNEREFQIGKTGRLEFDNVNITSIKIGKNISEFTPIIIDYIYIDEEE